MSEEPSRLTTLLNQLTLLSIEQQDRINETYRRHEHNVQQREEAFRDARRELEDNHKDEIAHDRRLLRDAKDRIYAEIQERRRNLLIQIRSTSTGTEEQEFVPKVSRTVQQRTSEAELDSSRDESADLADDIRELEDGRIEIIIETPVLPADATTKPKKLAIGSDVWVLNPLKLARVQKRTHLKARVIGTTPSGQYKLHVWNPILKVNEEHRRIRKNLALR